MPQLAKGGKHVFGWSRIRKDGTLRLPPEAVREYGLRKSEKLVLMSGSKTSGGIGVSSERLLRGSLLEVVLHRLAAAGRSSAPVRVSPQRRAVRARFDARGRFRLSPEALACYGIAPGDRLLVIRSSDIAIGMAHHGPLVKHALRFSDLKTF